MPGSEQPRATNPACSEQLELIASKPARTPEALHAALREASRDPVHLTITRNRVSMVSVRFHDDHVRVRAHEAFLSAEPEVIDALAAYVRNRRRKHWRVVADFAETIEPGPAARRPPRVKSRGAVHDLEAIRKRVNRTFFNGRLKCRVTWGRRGTPRRRARSRTIRYGTYRRADDLVSINPILDDPRVPEVFVEYIVFHEMLHAVVPSEKCGTWNHHTRTFRHLEKQFPDLPRMHRLSDELVTRLGR